MAGPRQPIDLLLVKGRKNLTKAEIEERRKSEVKAKDDNVSAPDYLTEELQNRFNELASELLEIKIMSNLDVDALARFVFHQSEWERVSKVLRETDPADEQYSKLLILVEKHFKACRQSSMDLGLTISSRCKLVVPKQEEKKELSEFEKKFGDSL